MPVVQIEVGDDGKVTGELPDALKTHVSAQVESEKKRIEKEISDRAFNEGFQKGNAKKAEELKPHLVDPAERERLKTLEQENEKLKIAELEREKKYEEANKIREDRFQKDLQSASEETKRLRGKLHSGAQAEIKAMALKHGAREESLDELAYILGGEIDFDERLEPVIKGADGKPAVDGKGQPLTIEGRVRAYLDQRRHHLKGSSGTGGGARGGASLTNLSDEARDAEQKRDAAREKLQKNPGDAAAVNELFEAEKALKQAINKGK